MISVTRNSHMASFPLLTGMPRWMYWASSYVAVVMVGPSSQQLSAQEQEQDQRKIYERHPEHQPGNMDGALTVEFPHQRQPGDAENNRSACVKPARAKSQRPKARGQEQQRIQSHGPNGSRSSRIESRQHLQTGPLVLVAINPGNSQEVRHLPEEQDREQRGGLPTQIAARSRPADQRRGGARHGAHESVPPGPAPRPPVGEGV